MPTPSEGFINALHSFDPLLSVKWGDHIGRWVIERQAYIGSTEVWYMRRRTERFRVRVINNPDNVAFRTAYDEIREELRAVENNKRVVLMPKELGSPCFNALGLMDIHRWGGYSRMAEELESQEAARERDQERMLSNERQALNKQAADIMGFLWRKRLTQLANGEHLHKSLKELCNTSEL
jgi:hypothetical protein